MQSVALIGHGTRLCIADDEGRRVEVATAGGALTITDPPDDPGKSSTTLPSGPVPLSTGPHRLTSTMEPATGWHDARDSVREAAARGHGTRTDRAYRRGLRGRGQR